MASGRGKKGGPVKNPKREVEEDDDFLDDLAVDTQEEPKKGATYSNLKPGGFLTKAKDCKDRLTKRQVRIAAAREQDDNDDDDDDEEETEKEQLEGKPDNYKAN